MWRLRKQESMQPNCRNLSIKEERQHAITQDSKQARKHQTREEASELKKGCQPRKKKNKVIRNHAATYERKEAIIL